MCAAARHRDAGWRVLVECLPFMKRQRRGEVDRVERLRAESGTAHERRRVDLETGESQASQQLHVLPGGRAIRPRLRENLRTLVRIGVRRTLGQRQRAVALDLDSFDDTTLAIEPMNHLDARRLEPVAIDKTGETDARVRIVGPRRRLDVERHEEFAVDDAALRRHGSTGAAGEQQPWRLRRATLSDPIGIAGKNGAAEFGF